MKDFGGDNFPAGHYRNASKGSRAMSQTRVSNGAASMNVETTVAPGYKPSDDEPFMCDKHKEYFRTKLIEWKN